jgi:hypothetical protein
LDTSKRSEDFAGQLPRVRECAQRVETDLCHAQSVEALPVRLETGAFEQLTVPYPRSSFVVLHSSVLRLPESEYGSPRHWPKKLTIPVDKPDALDVGANSPTSSYRAGKSVEVE